MRKLFGIAIVLAPLAAGIGAAIALGRRGGGRLGAFVDDDTDQGSDPSAPTRDEPDDDGCLMLGKKHLNYGDSYRVCLTANQDKKLFQGKRNRLRKLGCGTFACAYEAPAKSRVVKFTRDGEDVAALLRAQGSGVVPKVFAVYKLAQGGRTIPKEDHLYRREPARNVDVYALVVERLRPVSRDERDILNEEMSHIRMNVVDHKQSPESFCRMLDVNGDGGCSEPTKQILAAYEKLQARGIKWTDMHAGNIGYDKTGKLKVLDLGVTGTQFDAEPDILQGPRERLNLLRRI